MSPLDEKRQELLSLDSDICKRRDDLVTARSRVFSVSINRKNVSKLKSGYPDGGQTTQRAKARIENRYVEVKQHAKAVEDALSTMIERKSELQEEIRTLQGAGF